MITATPPCTAQLGRRYYSAKPFARSEHPRNERLFDALTGGNTQGHPQRGRSSW